MTIHTKDGLARIVDGVRLAAVHQGRWRLPAGAYDASRVREEARRNENT